MKTCGHHEYDAQKFFQCSKECADSLGEDNIGKNEVDGAASSLAMSLWVGMVTVSAGLLLQFLFFWEINTSTAAITATIITTATLATTIIITSHNKY